MQLLRLNNVSIAFGHVSILDQVNVKLDSGERVCIVGRNGEGKSTLLKIIANQLQADEGEVEKKIGLKVGYLKQTLPTSSQQSVYEYVATELGELGKTLAAYQEKCMAALQDHSPALQAEIMDLQHEIDLHHGWTLDNKVKTILSQLELNPDAKLGTLSGGWCRRVSLASALLHNPDVLLLDEPTNHLDISMIEWLEDYLLKFQGCILFVSHDRFFIDKLATRIIELDRGNLTSWPGNYQKYCETKAHELEVEARHNAKFDKKLSQEETWIRQGIKARRTRNEGRVRALKSLREERANRREVKGKANLSLEDNLPSGKLVARLTKVSHGFDDKNIINDFSTTILRGDRVGLIGPNGIGKTTLLKIFTGELLPKSGKVELGTNLKVAYFSQTRTEIDMSASVVEAIADGQQELDIGGKKRHVISYLKDFLFSAERARSPVSSLSGGEYNRLLLARLFLKPCNLIVMDEPTNDLDIETLELLEERLIEFSGTLLLVSHDRSFLDNVVTSTLSFEGNAVINENVGGYSHWLSRFKQSQASAKPSPTKLVNTKKQKPKENNQKLTYNEQRELKSLPKKIEVLEEKLVALQAQTCASGFYQQPKKVTDITFSDIQRLQAELEKTYSRWETLENKAR